MAEESRLVETITLRQARAIIHSMANEQSLLLLSPPGVGKSDTVRQAALDAGLECRSLLGTQIAPEDVSGIPRIVGERSVFCPPRVLLPEDARPFCLFLDELPACAPDVQKAFYSLLLERRLGEHPLPPGTWVVAAGNRVEDRALVRALSSALVNRVLILNIRVDVDEWLTWAEQDGIRRDVRDFIQGHPDALLRGVPAAPVPFSTPRAWASLAAALHLAEKADILTRPIRRALAFGRVTQEDAKDYCEYCEEIEDAPRRAEEEALRKAEEEARQREEETIYGPMRQTVGLTAADLPVTDFNRLQGVMIQLHRKMGVSLDPTQKISAIKTLRLVVGRCGLKEAKDAVEAVMASSESQRDQLLAELGMS